MTNRTYKTYRTYTTAIGFFIFYILFLIFPASPAYAQTVSPYCFREQECKGTPYSGIPKEASECGENIQGKAAFDAGYRFNCFAPPPTVSLQVSIGKYKVEGIEDYILQLYTYLVSIAAIVAGIMIVFAGFKWLTSGGSPERITDAKKKIANAIVGMALVFGSYLILQTVNPSLVRLRTPPVKMARKEFAPVQTDCVPRPEFICGTPYNCSNPQDPGNPPCGARGSGTCLGQVCQNSAEHCARPISQRITDRGDIGARIRRNIQNNPRVCVNPSVCANCASITEPRICISTACNCVWTSGGCRSPLANGQECDNDIQCASRLCVDGECGNPAPIGGGCDRGVECQSGLCNVAEDGPGGSCVAPRSLPDRTDCSASVMCQSERCGYSRAGIVTPGVDAVCGERFLIEIFGAEEAAEATGGSQ